MGGDRSACTRRGQRICELAEQAARSDDPESALRTLTELRDELDQAVRDHVRRGLASGCSFSDLARALGISRQAAHRRFRDLAPPRPITPRRRLEATGPARVAVRLARAETIASGAAAIGSHHVLLGILRTDSDAARALRSQGITLERARACGHGTDRQSRSGGDPDCVRRILRTAGRTALARGDGRLGSEELLLAAVEDPDGGAGGILTALGAAPASIRARLGC
jgi:hypothetical protein